MLRIEISNLNLKSVFCIALGIAVLHLRVYGSGGSGYGDEDTGFWRSVYHTDMEL